MQPTNAFRYHRSNVRRLLPASDYYRARGNQIVEHHSDNGTVLGISRKLGGAAEHLIDGSENALICRLSFGFCPGVPVHKGITIVLSLFRSHWLDVGYCLVLCSGTCEPVHEDRTEF